MTAVANASQARANPRYRPMVTAWEPCAACGATTRHDDGLCIRNPRHPRYDERIPNAFHGPTAQVAKAHP